MTFSLQEQVSLGTSPVNGSNLPCLTYVIVGIFQIKLKFAAGKLTFSKKAFEPNVVKICLPV